MARTMHRIHHVAGFMFVVWRLISAALLTTPPLLPFNLRPHPEPPRRALSAARPLPAHPAWPIRPRGPPTPFAANPTEASWPQPTSPRDTFPAETTPNPSFDSHELLHGEGPNGTPVRAGTSPPAGPEASHKNKAEPSASGPRHRYAVRESITATTAAAAATAAATKVTTRAAITGGTLFLGSGNVHRQVPAIQRGSVHGFNGLLRLLGRAHRYEGKAPGATRHAVHHQVGLDHRAVCSECILEIVLSRVEREISNKQFRAHAILLLSFCLRLTATFRRLFPTVGFQIVTEPSSLEDFPCL